MTESTSLWILTVDRRTARLLRANVVQHARLHVDELSRLEESWDEHQHGHPSPRLAEGGHTNASEGHEPDERLQRFARQVAGWLEARVREAQIPRVHIFAARRFLGALRKDRPSGLKESVTEHTLDLAPLTPSELAVHPAVTALPEVERARKAARGDALESASAPVLLDRHLLYEQAAIRSALEDLRGVLDRLRAEPGPEHAPGRLSGMLLMFTHQLRRHFEFEEQSGLFTSMTREQLDDVAAKHQALDAQLAGLVDAVERSSDGSACLSDSFVDGMSQWLGSLARHEKEKRDLVQELVSELAAAGIEGGTGVAARN